MDEHDEHEEPATEEQPEWKHALPQDVRDALDSIAKDDEDGLIETQKVVDAARDPESPLHRYFTWDDADAAEQHRRAQARALIGRYTVYRIDEGPKYVNIKIRKVGLGESRRGYAEVARAAVDPDLYGQIIHDAEAGIRSYRNRLSAFEQAHRIVSALDEALGEMGTTTTTEEGNEDG